MHADRGITARRAGRLKRCRRTGLARDQLGAPDFDEADCGAEAGAGADDESAGLLSAAGADFVESASPGLDSGAASEAGALFVA